MLNRKFIKQKGFSKILVIIIALAVVAGGILAWQYWPEETAPPADQGQPETEQPAVNEETDETADWQAYRNEEYGFEFKYPVGFRIISDASGSYHQEEGVCSIVHEIQLINPVLSERCWEPSNCWIPRLLVLIQEADCEIVQPPYQLKEELENIGVPQEKMYFEIFNMTNCDQFIVKAGDFYGVKVLGCLTGPVHPVTNVSIFPAENFIIDFRDESSDYQVNGIFDQMLSTFKFVD